MGPRIPLITGPTAVGKSSVALALAESHGGEIVSCDSRQVYAELEIGTARPTSDEMARVPHHLVGVATLSDPWSAGRFGREAEVALTDIKARGAQPVVIGGSTLYIQALVDGLADIPATDPAVRNALNEKLQIVGSEVLYEALFRVDPVFAETLDATKSQRIIRGLEVYASTGHPLSYFFKTVPPPAHSYRVIVLDRDREDLYRRIDARVHAMMDAGQLDEVYRLMQQGFDPEENPLRTIGYSELAPVLRGETTLEEAVILIQRNSRRYAKRQLTWLRGRPDATWLNVEAEDSAESLAERIAELMEASGD
ncbi:MAG: tRNA dimethylallyltransferase [Rhodothermales bacterium]|jgi:tRNA dimethylallyltransferase